MGLSNFPSPAEGVLPLLVMNTVLSVALLKNMVRSVIHVVVGTSTNFEVGQSSSSESFPVVMPSMSDINGGGGGGGGRAARRRISITKFKSLCEKRSCGALTTSSNFGGNVGSSAMECCCCCVCLCRFEGGEEVSELSCKHFFHKGCLEKWFENQHSTCPLCRSIL